MSQLSLYDYPECWPPCHCGMDVCVSPGRYVCPLHGETAAAEADRQWPDGDDLTDQQDTEAQYE